MQSRVCPPPFYSQERRGFVGWVAMRRLFSNDSTQASQFRHNIVILIFIQVFD